MRLDRIRFLLPTLFLAALLACEARDPPSQDREMTADTFSFLALGDSYTIGERVDSTLRWPVQLARRLRDEGVPVADPLIIARTGWTTDELDAGIDARIDAGVDGLAPLGPYSLVSLLIGVNNQYRGRDLEEYRVKFRELLDRAIGFAGGDAGRVLVLSIPDWGVMPFAQGRVREAIAGEIDAFNAANRDACLARGVHWVDVTGISREAASDPGLVAEDGLHPSGAQYSRWVEAALPVAKAILAIPDG